MNFFKHLGGYLAFLVSLFVLPLALFLQFSPYKEPRITYVFLICLFASQYAYYQEKKYRKKIENSVRDVLKQEFDRLPSRKEIIQRSDRIVQGRGICIIITALLIIGLMIVYKAF